MPDTTSIKTGKTALRRVLLADRQAIPDEVRREWNAAIAARLIAWCERHQTPSLGVYWPIRGEPDLQGAYAALSTRGVRLALPVVLESDAPLVFIEWKPGDPMDRDGFGVAIPAEGAEMRPDTLLVPCVGFNDARFRMGYGGGFYDRTLAATPRPSTIGVSYECGRTAFNPDPHDIALDAIITEVAQYEAA